MASTPRIEVDMDTIGRAVCRGEAEAAGDQCATCGLSRINAVAPDGEMWHEGGACPGPPCLCGSGWPDSECVDRGVHVTVERHGGGEARGICGSCGRSLSAPCGNPGVCSRVGQQTSRALDVAK